MNTTTLYSITRAVMYTNTAASAALAAYLSLNGDLSGGVICLGTCGLSILVGVLATHAQAEYEGKIG